MAEEEDREDLSSCLPRLAASATELDAMRLLSREDWAMLAKILSDPNSLSLVEAETVLARHPELRRTARGH